MQLPQPTAEHQRLAAFAGTWEGDETLHPAPFRAETAKARGRFVSRMGLDGFFLIVDYHERQGDVPTYAGHGVYGWDAKAGRYTMDWFDSMGGFYEKVVHGTWEGEILRFEADSPRGRARFTYEWHGRDEFAFGIDTSADGGATWTPFMDGRYRRVSA